MAIKTKNWSTGTGSVTIQYGGQGDGEIIVTSDANSLYEARSMQIAIETTDGSGISRNITINQTAKQRIDLSAAVVTAATQTYSGSAKTPTPTVTLNGTTIPSSGYDVSYSNNTNAGTATITVTGKGDYTGTATGTFTINKATPTYTAPTYRSLTYSGNAQYLTTSGSTSDGTIQYSSDGTNWYSTRRQGTDAGNYTTYWRLIGDSNHTDVNATSISTTIAKATPSYTAPVTKSLTYNGSYQDLCTTGSTHHGIIYYRLSDLSWSTSIPQGIYADPGYAIYFKIIGDSNHLDVGSTFIGYTSIAKASRTISFGSPTTQVAKGSSVTNSASVSAGDGTISYSSSNTSYATVNSSGKVTGVSKGSVTITASIPETTNYKSASASYIMKVYEWVTNSKTFSVNTEHSSRDDKLSITCQLGSIYRITLSKDSSLSVAGAAVYVYNDSSHYVMYDTSDFSWDVPFEATFRYSGDAIGVYVYAPDSSGNITISATVQVF